MHSRFFQRSHAPYHCVAFGLVKLLAVLLLSCSSLSAQQHSQTPPDLPPPTTFQVFLWEKYTPPGTPSYDTPAGPYVPPSFRFVDSTNTSHPVGAVDRRFSPTHEAFGDRVIFVNEAPSPDGQGIHRTAVGEVSLPPNCPHVLLFFFPKKSADSEQYNILAIPASRGDIPPGSLLTLNISNEPLVAMIGEEKVGLAPGAGQLISTPTAKASPLPLIVGARDDEGKWVRRHHKQLALRQEASNMLLIYRIGKNYRSIVLENQLDH
ncbi:hypothetical protein H5P28_15030 [Ruficoccus amylovorans]|uniref:Uncharacterized protein n=1 Tax=Ruficoccus amylovorans TaxID=1804625 RepID=A0A842HGZ0_9BACT|nr:hypothetical protein [Ruficoccus amylovorans]MBC2595579.1 hypothetical protein [Ruficoccus amylovorans]